MASDNCCALVKTTVWEESLSTLAKNWEGAESPAAVKAAATVTTVGLGRCRRGRGAGAPRAATAGGGGRRTAASSPTMEWVVLQSPSGED